MKAAGPAMRSSHLRQPGEGAPLRRETPRERVVVEVPELRQSVKQGGGKGAVAAQAASHQSTNRYMQ